MRGYPGLTALEGIQDHKIDNERSAVLVAAPVGDYSYNLDPWSYSGYSYYTAAHENTDVDKSRYYDFPTSPVPAGWHINLALSLSKHATYAFNPDYMTILPDYVIYSVIAGVEVKLRDNTKLSGCVSEAGEERFVVVDAKAGSPVPVAYPQVKQMKGKNHWSGKEIAITAAVAALIVIPLVIFASRD